jgi:hypothetical protein
MPILSFDLPSDFDFTSADSIREAGPRIRIDIARASGPDPNEPHFKTSDQVLALIDTGASISIVRRGFADQLGAHAVDTTMIYGIHDTRGKPSPVYQLRYRVESLQEAQFARFVGVDLVPSIPVVLGREFLADKIMVYDGKVGRVTLAV